MICQERDQEWENGAADNFAHASFPPRHQNKEDEGTPCQEGEKKRKGETSIQQYALFHILVFQCPNCNKYPPKKQSMSRHVLSCKLKTPLKCTYSGCNSVSIVLLFLLFFYIWTIAKIDKFADRLDRKCNEKTCIHLPQGEHKKANKSLDIIC